MYICLYKSKIRKLSQLESIAREVKKFQAFLTTIERCILVQKRESEKLKGSKRSIPVQNLIC